MSEASNTNEPPPNVVAEFKRQLDKWASEFRRALTQRFASKKANDER